LPRLRSRQIDLIRDVGHGVGSALRLPGITTLLKLSRGPAHAAGLAELQGFLERGVAAFKQLGDADAFLAGHPARRTRESPRALLSARRIRSATAP
jgi:hypothetical protein